MKSPLNNIILNATLLESLYGCSLVGIGDQPAAPAIALKYLGGNASRITVLVHQPDHGFLPEEHLSFLTKMLQACKLNIGDTAIVNMAGGAAFSEVLARLNPAKIIAFGVQVPGSEVPLMTIGQLEGAALLNAPGLSEIVSESPEAKIQKGRLWLCLKTLFTIS